jgi:hypothetical protein
VIALPFVSGKVYLEMTIICCLPSLPVEIFWHLLTPFRRLYLRLRYDSRRAASTLPLGSRAERFEYALTRACFHAGEICVLDFFDRLGRNAPDHWPVTCDFH